MNVFSFYRRFQGWWSSPRVPVRRPRPRGAFLQAEQLEDRLLLSTYIVTNTGDSAQAGSGSLRRAIMDANAHAGNDLIKFNIQTMPGQGVPPVITPNTPLPGVTDTVTIDGTSEPQWDMVQITDSNPGQGIGLDLEANGCHIKGLDLTDWNYNLAVNSKNNEIDHNFIGLDSMNAVYGDNGIIIMAGNQGQTASGNQIHDNVISGNVTDVLFSTGAANNTLQNNKIGTDPSGEIALRGNEYGVDLIAAASGNKILNNLISASSSAGVECDLKATDNLIQNNLIGTDATGTMVLGNATGVALVGGSNNNTVQGNTIGGSTQNGILLSDVTGSKITGNFIGVDKTFLHKLAQDGNGVEIRDAASNNTLTGNVMFFNSGQGVWIHGQGTNKNQLSKNAMGYNTLDGVLVSDQASNNQIGIAGAGNYINANGGAGVAIGSSSIDTTVGNSILSNTIYDNGGLGIDLGSNGATPNVPSNPAGGPNQAQNHPVLTAALTANGAVTIAGKLHSAPKQTYRLEFFFALDGEGMIYIGSAEVTTDANGDASFAKTFSTAMTQIFAKQGAQITATATDKALNNTSEFSDPVTVAPFLVFPKFHF